MSLSTCYLEYGRHVARLRRRRRCRRRRAHAPTSNTASHAYQTHCPQMRRFALQWLLHGVHATTRAQSTMFYDQNKHGQSTETNVMSSTAFCGRILWAPRKEDGESGTKTQNRQGFVWCGGCWSGYDAKTAKNSFRGIESRILWMAW